MFSKPLRLLGWLAYSLILVTVFVVSGYFAFSLFVRSGVTAVPDLKGLAREQATALLRDQGLEASVREEPRYDEEVPADHVVLQDPGAGSLVKRGSIVEVVTSLGQELVEVPAGRAYYRSGRILPRGVGVRSATSAMPSV